ncbi:MAG: peptidase M24 [Myxococcales bacterium]|nr:peptidase M24 [Myxococcales bacterium]
MPIESVRSGQHIARQHGAMEFSEPPVDLDGVRLYRLARLRQEMRAEDVSGLLLFDQINTRYATDATNMQVWCSHYETRCVFVALEGPVVLYDYANHPHLAKDLPGVDEYRVMPSFYFFSAGSHGETRAQKFAAEIEDLMRAYGGDDRCLGIDRLSFMPCDALRKVGLNLREGEGIAERARSVKSHDELALMRVSMDTCEAACRSMQEALAPGITENALWARMHETNIRMGGEWVETRLLSSGPRTNPWFRECSMRPIENGDLVSFDTDLIGPYGYCSDISRSWLCGDRPSDEQRRLYAVAYEQIETNISALRPGRTLHDVSNDCWRIPPKYLSNRYPSLMHGVGLADEYPSIKHQVDLEAKGYEGLIHPGMVICVESFIGVEGGREGVKLEEQVIITETGVERMSSLPFETD